MEGGVASGTATGGRGGDGVNGGTGGNGFTGQVYVGVTGGNASGTGIGGDGGSGTGAGVTGGQGAGGIVSANKLSAADVGGLNSSVEGTATGRQRW